MEDSGSGRLNLLYFTCLEGAGGSIWARFGSSLGGEWAWEIGGRNGSRSRCGQARSNTLDQRWVGGYEVGCLRN